GAPTEQSILSAALRDAISSREFLVYQPHSGQLVPSPELNAMYALDSAIEHYRSLRTHLRVRQDALLAEAESAKNQMRPARIMGQDLLLTLALGDLMINILRLSFAMLDYISDPSQGIKMPELVDLAISGEKSNVIREEQATHADIEHWRVDHELRSRILS